METITYFLTLASMIMVLSKLEKNKKRILQYLASKGKKAWFK